METLVSDCFPQIFSYLSLADLLHLRTVSRRLKQEIEDYLPNVRSLPLYLTSQRTPEEIARYETMCVSYKNSQTIKGNDYSEMLNADSDDVSVRRLPFGTSGSGAFEDLTILQNQNHFRRSDFLILNHSSALLKFLPFIKKHSPNIEKLGLVIDHCEHYLPEVNKVFDAFPAVKVLLLESTLQDSCRHPADRINGSPAVNVLHDLITLEKNRVKLSPKVQNSILGLNHLEELYLFSKRQGQLVIECRIGNRHYRFVKTLLERLRVFHLNTRRFLGLPVGRESVESIEELAGPMDILHYVMFNERLIFPKLKKLTLYSPQWCFTREHFPLPRPLLKVLDIANEIHMICPISTQNLNYFTGLESFHCRWIELNPLYERMPKRTKKGKKEVENYDLEIVPESLKNLTIKHLQVMVVIGSKTMEQRKREARRWSKYFVALETFTVLEPEYSVIQISDLQN